MKWRIYYGVPRDKLGDEIEERVWSKGHDHSRTGDDDTRPIGNLQSPKDLVSMGNPDSRSVDFFTDNAVQKIHKSMPHISGNITLSARVIAPPRWQAVKNIYFDVDPADPTGRTAKGVFYYDI